LRLREVRDAVGRQLLGQATDGLGIRGLSPRLQRVVGVRRTYLDDQIPGRPAAVLGVPIPRPALKPIRNDGIERNETDAAGVTVLLHGPPIVEHPMSHVQVLIPRGLAQVD